MDPYGADVVNVSLQLEGLRAAVDRLALAASKRDAAGETYLPLFEALDWAVSLDQRVQHLWRPEGRDKKLGEGWRLRVHGGERITGIDWARNGVHHQWADALRLDPAGHGLYPSATLYPSPELYPKPDHAWVWRDADGLPARRDRRKASKTKAPAGDVEPMGGREAYETYLQGRPAAETMADLLATFQLVGELLEPPRAMRTE